MKTEVNETQVNFDDVQDYQTNVVDSNYLIDSLTSEFPGPGEESDDDIDEPLIGDDDDDLSDTEDDSTILDDDDDLSNIDDEDSIIDGAEDDSGDIGENDLSVDDELTDDDETQI
ncbi:hypothetical protein [Pedobacter sp. Leaf176]|uniref:hypothetical protein n=1 Tax=Pedobacter sp. Leaf176 TaxID=1736286 RepID=UPI0006F32D72|nr:hypothetical protein [Pedobacter sp. Leaf176]KQR71012.1 hypothetical protein ASF92_06320 [Pedobacter sp. Leaf176]